MNVIMMVVHPHQDDMWSGSADDSNTCGSAKVLNNNQTDMMGVNENDNDDDDYDTDDDEGVLGAAMALDRDALLLPQGKRRL